MYHGFIVVYRTITRLLIFTFYYQYYHIGIILVGNRNIDTTVRDKRLRRLFGHLNKLHVPNSRFDNEHYLSICRTDVSAPSYYNIISIPK